MDIQEISNAVACTMVEICSHFPKRAPGKVIKVPSPAAITEFCSRKVQRTTQNCSKEYLLFLCSWTHHYCSSHIRGSFQILSACVSQQESLCLNRYVCLRCSRIVVHCRMGAVGDDRIKTVAHEVFLLCAQAIQILCGTDLRDLSLSHILFQPINKFRHCHTVFDMGYPFIFHFRRGFDRLWKKCQVLFVEDND